MFIITMSVQVNLNLLHGFPHLCTVFILAWQAKGSKANRLKCINYTNSSIIETKTGLSLYHSLDEKGNRIRLPASDKFFSLLHRVSDWHWCPLTLLTNGYKRLFLYSEMARE